jgi:hypothetical protein
VVCRAECSRHRPKEAAFRARGAHVYRGPPHYWLRNCQCLSGYDSVRSCRQICAERRHPCIPNPLLPDNEISNSLSVPLPDSSWPPPPMAPGVGYRSLSLVLTRGTPFPVSLLPLTLATLLPGLHKSREKGGPVFDTGRCDLKGAARQPWILAGERSSLLTRIAANLTQQ